MSFLSWQTMAVTTYTNEEARLKLEGILRRPEFANKEAFTKWLQSVADGLARLFNRVTGKNVKIGNLSFLESILAILAAALVLLALIYICLRLFRYFAPEYAEAPALGDDSTSINTDQLRTQASVCAEKGEYREAIRYLYLSLLLFLDQKRLIRYRLSKTNHEYLQEFRKNETGQDGFYGVVSFFEDKWYGMEPCSNMDYRQFQAMYMNMVKEK